MVKLSNESALGTYVFSWVSENGTKCQVIWGAGLSGPLFAFWPEQERQSAFIEILNPERFGWQPPAKVADFRNFVQRFADACEE